MCNRAGKKNLTGNKMTIKNCQVQSANLAVLNKNFAAAVVLIKNQELETSSKFKRSLFNNIARKVRQQSRESKLGAFKFF
jgi:hypothetical protein